MRLCLAILMLFCFPLGSPGQGIPATPEEVVRNIQKAYSQHCCFRAVFDQLTVNVAMDIKDKFHGVMFVKKPGLILLDVQSPEKQQVSIQGRAYKVYFPDEGNAAQGEIPPELNLEHFFGFFANIVEIEQNFVVSFPAKAVDVHDKLIFLQLADKKNTSGTYSILIGVDAENYSIRRAIIYDALGNYNRFDLSSIKFLDNIPDSHFQIGKNLSESELGKVNK